MSYLVDGSRLNYISVYAMVFLRHSRVPLVAVGITKWRAAAIRCSSNVRSAHNKSGGNSAKPQGSA